VRLYIPGINPDQDTLSAGLAYAKAGWYVLPVLPDGKHAGSRLGKNWPEKTSRDPETIISWFAGTSDLLALHIGRSGAITFDVDHPDRLPPLLRATLLAVPGPFQSTREEDPERGHYLYAVPPGRMFGNGRGQLNGSWGEVRGRNGIIVASPSLHPHGGRYQWIRTGELPELPAVLAEQLPDGSPGNDAATDAEVAAFLDRHATLDRPELLTTRLTRIAQQIEKGASRHVTTTTETVLAMKEAAAGYYPARDAYSEIREVFVHYATRQHPADPAGQIRTPDQARAEFHGIAAWAIGQASRPEAVAEAREWIETNRPDLTFVYQPPATPAPATAPPDATPADATPESDTTDTPPEAEPGPVEPWREIADQYEILDWHKLWEDVPDDVDWLIEPVIERGQLIAIYSPPKAGKSLITLEWAAGLATGRAVLGNPARPPARVLYVDIENSPKDIKDRLTAMGYKPADLENLRYLSFPSLPALDSPRGGQHLLAVAQAHQATLVIVDTVSRIISGSENDADTFANLYRYALAPLKGLGISVIRLDHSGKDVTQGQRGSSAKASDVDTVWLLVKKTDTALHLKREETRSGRGEPVIELVRKFEPLRHERANGFSVESQIDGIIKRLDELGVPKDAGRDKAREALSKSGMKVANSHLAEAIRTRKLRLDLSGTGPASAEPQPFTSPVPTPVRTEPVSAGPTCPGQVPDRSDRSSGVAADDLSAAGPSLKDGQRDRSAHLTVAGEVAPCQGCGTPMQVIVAGQTCHPDPNCEQKAAS